MRILFVCAGNTCRSPMMAAILKQKLKAAKISEKFEIDSASYGVPTLNNASDEAIEAIKIKYDEDLLGLHRPKRINPALIQWADIILVMTAWMKEGLPQDKTFTLKEFAGDSGDIPDPLWQGINTYLQVADEISDAIAKIVPRLLQS